MRAAPNLRLPLKQPQSSGRLGGRNLSENSLLPRVVRPKPHATPIPYSSADDISSLNRTSSESSSDESPSESPPPPANYDVHCSKENKNFRLQKPLPPLPNDLAALKNMCTATGISSDGLYDNTSTPPRPPTNYVGDSCTSFEFRSDAEGSDSRFNNHKDHREDHCLSDGRESSSKKNEDSSAPSTGNRKDSSSQTDKSYVKKGSRISDFEKEIKKLLERQQLPNVDELASVQKVLSVMDKLRLVVHLA